MRTRLRWRSCTPGEAETAVARLADWPCEVGGPVRHMFALATIEAQGHTPIRLVSDAEPILPAFSPSIKAFRSFSGSRKRWLPK